MLGGNQNQCKVEHLYYTFLGGDQVTVSRARGCQKIRSDSITPMNRLEGLIRADAAVQAGAAMAAPLF